MLPADSAANNGWSATQRTGEHLPGMSENAREALRDRLQHDDPRPVCTTASEDPSSSISPDQGDDLHEECGIFGVYAPGDDVARLTFFGLFALQHRGQES